MKINHSSPAEIDERQHEEIAGKPVGDNPSQAESGVGALVSENGAIPSGSEMAHWTTAMARADATHPTTMPGTKSTAMPGETNHEARNNV